MAAKPLRGYKRLPGSAHRYRTPNGVEISEYEYRSRKARKAGWGNAAQQRRFRESKDFRSWRFKALSEDRDIEVGAGSDIERAARDVMRARATDDQAVLTDPEGAMELLLVATGKRRAEWDWAVGETPAGVAA